MIYVTPEEQIAFHSGRQKNLKLTFSDGTVITNEDILLESMTLDQSISSGDMLEFGKVSSACFKVTVLNVVQRFKGLTVHAEITAPYDDELSFTRSLGWFKVVSDKATSDRIGRDLECYDALYDVLTEDYSNWHNNLPFPMTFKDYRDAFFEHIGIEQEEWFFPNDSVIIEKNFVSDNYSGADVLHDICEFNGVCGEINYDGIFRYIHLTVDIEGLYPSNDLYPVEPDPGTHEGLYPRDPESYTLRRNFYVAGSLRYEEFQCQQITQLQVRMSEGDIGAIVGTEGNTYIIQDNPLMYGMRPTTLETVANNIFSMIRTVFYTPASITAPCSPWFQLGDVIRIISDKDSPVICIINRHTSGITKLMDDYSCEGEEYYSEKANSIMRSITVLKQRSNELVRNVEENYARITEVDTDLQGTKTELRSEIQQTSNSINLRINEVVTNQEAVNASFSLSINEHTAAINARVNKGQVIGEINLEVNDSSNKSILTIKSNKISISSDNFTLTNTGVVTCYGANIGGSLKAVSGQIGCTYNSNNKKFTGGFYIKENAIYNTKNSFTHNSTGIYLGTNGIALGPNNKFSVDSDGNLKCTNAKVSGEITVTDGIILKSGSHSETISAQRLHNFIDASEVADRLTRWLFQRTWDATLGWQLYSDDEMDRWAHKYLDQW